MPVAPIRSKVLAGSQFDRRTVQRELNSRGFRSFLFGPNIDKLRSVGTEKYRKLLELLRIVGDHFKANYDNDGKLPGFDLPALAELRRIKIGRILATPAAVAEVKSRCVTTKGVDLRLLPWIYDTHVPKEESPA